MPSSQCCGERDPTTDLLHAQAERGPEFPLLYSVSRSFGADRPVLLELRLTPGAPRLRGIS